MEQWKRTRERTPARGIFQSLIRFVAAIRAGSLAASATGLQEGGAFAFLCYLLLATP
ncbi:MAG: hypothetical protein ONB46_18650 [candidate division KSB1 bacterium]|nr:hypothetical protein [candidate division KSB1 bacterium]MDZ7367901.1 hypothetical protein [candidate division KSB1 bacterium]MDZ7406532.1 hypothetical protein [candidate division KSB1 bacterium]